MCLGAWAPGRLGAWVACVEGRGPVAAGPHFASFPAVCYCLQIACARHHMASPKVLTQAIEFFDKMAGDEGAKLAAGMPLCLHVCV